MKKFVLSIAGWGVAMVLTYLVIVTAVRQHFLKTSHTVQFENGITMLFHRLGDKRLWISDHKVTVDQLEVYTLGETEEMLCEEATERTPSDLDYSVAKTTMEVAAGFCDWLSSSRHNAEWLCRSSRFAMARCPRLDDQTDPDNIVLTCGFSVVLVEGLSLIDLFCYLLAAIIVFFVGEVVPRILAWRQKRNCPRISDAA